MCGIVAVTGYKQALPLLINGLEKLEYRGYDSAGIAIINSETNCIICNKEEGKLKNLINNLNDSNIPGTVGIGHTRWATHGKISHENTHPHISQHQNIILVHNGIISNYAELKTELLYNNFTFYSETDTEVIANLIEYFLIYMNNDIEEAIKNCLNKLEGTWALVIIYTKDFLS